MTAPQDIAITPDSPAVSGSVQRLVLPGVELYLGDSLEIAPSLQGVDAVISDPPYGIEYNASVPSRGNTTGNVNLGKIIGDDAPFDPAPWLTYSAVVLWGANNYAGKLPHGRWLAWNKLGPLEPWDQFSDVEFAWHSERGADKIFSHLWKGMCQAGAGTKRIHPTQKPVPLMAWCMDQAKVPAGAVVLDPYMGSGSTIIAAIRTGRKAIGIEKDPEHFKNACERIKRELAQGDLFHGQNDQAHFRACSEAEGS